MLLDTFICRHEERLFAVTRNVYLLLSDMFIVIKNVYLVTGDIYLLERLFTVSVNACLLSEIVYSTLNIHSSLKKHIYVD